MKNTKNIASAALLSAATVTSANATDLISTKNDFSNRVEKSISVVPRGDGIVVSWGDSNKMASFELTALASSPVVGIKSWYYNWQFWAFVDVKKWEDIFSVFTTWTYNSEKIWAKATVWKMVKDFEWKNLWQLFAWIELDASVSDSSKVWLYANKTKTDSKVLESKETRKKLNNWYEVVNYSKTFEWYGKDSAWVTFSSVIWDEKRDIIMANLWYSKDFRTSVEGWVSYEHLTKDLKTKLWASLRWNNNWDFGYDAKISTKFWNNSEIGVKAWVDKFNWKENKFVWVSYTFNFDWNSSKYNNFSVPSNNFKEPYSHVIGADLASKNLYWATKVSSSTDFIKNEVPEFVTPTQTLQAEVSEEIKIQLKATDKDGFIKEYSASNLPEWLTIDEKTGIISWKISKADIYNFSVYATDDFGSKIEWKISIFVNNSSITKIEPETEIIYDNTKPEGYENIEKSSDFLVWIKKVITDKNWKIIKEVIVKNPEGKYIKTIWTKKVNTSPVQPKPTVPVTPLNSAPEISDQNTKWKVWENFSYKINAKDADGTIQKVEIIEWALPNGLNLNGLDINWIPKSAWTTNLKIKVTDDKWASKIANLTLEIEKINKAPIIKDQLIKQKVWSIVYNIVATDDGTIEKVEIIEWKLPDWVELIGQRIFWQANTPWNSSVKVRVTDNEWASSEAIISFEIEKQKEAPELQNQNIKAKEWENFSYKILAEAKDWKTLDFVEIVSWNLPEGLKLNWLNINWTPKKAGNSEITVRVVDSEGLSKEAKISISVEKNTVNEAPEVIEKSFTFESNRLIDWYSQEIDEADDNFEVLWIIEWSLPEWMKIHTSTWIFGWITKFEWKTEFTVRMKNISRGIIKDYKISLEVKKPPVVKMLTYALYWKAMGFSLTGGNFQGRWNGELIDVKFTEVPKNLSWRGLRHTRLGVVGWIVEHKWPNIFRGTLYYKTGVIEEFELIVYWR